MEKLGPYELITPMSAKDSGYSIWTFGKKYGRTFFIKQFLSPKYPENDNVSGEARIAKRRKKCEAFEKKKAALYKAVNDHTDGNAVRVEEFFRIGTKYYVAMPKVESMKWDMNQIVHLSERDKRYLCSVIAHSIGGLHQGHVVHADLKPDNILFARAASGHFTAKLIDFDSGFLETDPPADGEELVGDQVYFSPEACKTFMGQSTELTCKMDVFAMGVLFHQYFTGKVPEHDPELGFYVGEAVARGGKAVVSEEIPEDVRALLIRMLDADPNQRPTALEVHAALAEKEATLPPRPGSEGTIND